MEITIILPSYLEEENLRILLPRIKNQCLELGCEFEVLVIDTQSQLDATKEICRELEVKYIPREGTNSYGDAVRTGIHYSTGKFVIFMDADGSHSPNFIKNLYDKRNESSIIIASRYVQGGFTENNKILILMSLMVNMGYRFILGLKCKDVSNSFKLYPGDRLRELNLKCHNFDIVEEILFKLVKKNKSLQLMEIPFSFRKRMFGETKRNLITFVFTYFITLIKLRFNLN